MRFVVSKRLGAYGEGLGNEMLGWAKGWIASQVLDAALVGPSWGLNKRGYYRHFQASRFDYLLEDVLLRLPHHAFNEEDYIATGTIDFGAAIHQWATQGHLLGKRSFVIRLEGMWGGYKAIRTARTFLLGKLINSRDALRNHREVTSGLDRSKLFVAVHVRTAGDGFHAVNAGESERGKWNILLPPEWYLSVCEEIRRQFGDRVEFRFFTDRGGPHFEEALRRFNPGQLRQNGLTECSDLLLMAEADLRVCSVSSYSMAACFLSGGPYVWYEPQLTLDKGVYTFWGYEPAKQVEGSFTGNSSEFVAEAMTVRTPEKPQSIDCPGVAMKIGGTLPDALLLRLEQTLRQRDPRANLLEGGAIMG